MHKRLNDFHKRFTSFKKALKAEDIDNNKINTTNKKWFK